MTPEIAIVVVLPLVRVIDFLPPMPPTATKAQLRFDGEMLAVPLDAAPVPLRATV